jgi:hypothetical protein
MDFTHKFGEKCLKRLGLVQKCVCAYSEQNADRVLNPVSVYTPTLCLIPNAFEKL